MDVSMQLRALANSVGEDFAMNAPDDASRLVGRARRGRMVWSTGVGAAVVGSAASLAFGGPALASVLSSGPAVAPAGSSSPSATSSVSPSPDASATPSTTPSTSAPHPGEGNTNLGGVPGGVGSDDSAGDESGESETSGDSQNPGDDNKTGDIQKPGDNDKAGDSQTTDGSHDGQPASAHSND